MDELKELGVLDMKNGSVELFYDDEGVLQQVIYRRNKRKRQGDTMFTVLPVAGGKAIANYTHDGVLSQVVYETIWRRKLATQK